MCDSVRLLFFFFFQTCVQFLIMLKSHDRDDARHHRVPSWQPSNTPVPPKRECYPGVASRAGRYPLSCRICRARSLVNLF